MNIHRHLDDELKVLRELIVEMANLVDEQLASAIDAISRCDLELADRIRQRDDEVDALEIRIDHQCERILALQAPVAVDLRFIVTAVKVNTDLERIGDHAKNLAKNAHYLKGCTDLVSRTRMEEMADMARRILHEAQDAFIKRDRVLARQVLAHDRPIDQMHRETLSVIAALARAHPERAETLMQLVTMAKSIERIADHAKNIAENVVFWVEGVDIRHRRLQESPDSESL